MGPKKGMSRLLFRRESESYSRINAEFPLRSVGVSAVLNVAAIILAIRGPVSYGTNDDLLLTALADGSYTGRGEYQLVFSSPIYGCLLKVLNSITTKVDWNAATQIWLVLTSSYVLVSRLKIGRMGWGMRVLSIALLLYILPKFLMPLQFTSTAVLATSVGVLTSVSQPSFQAVRSIGLGSILVLFGISIRPEAGFLTLAIALPALIALEILWLSNIRRNSPRQADQQNFRLAKSVMPSLITALLVLALSPFNVRPSPLHQTFGKLNEALSEGRVDVLTEVLSRTEITVLRESDGLYFDNTDALAKVSTWAAAQPPPSIERSLGVVLKSIFGREYFGFQLALLAVVFSSLNPLSIRFRRISVVAAISGGISFLVLTFSYLQFQRLPYRLVMPVWTISTLILLTARIKFSYPQGRHGPSLRESHSPTSRILKKVLSRSNVSQWAPLLLSIFLLYPGLRYPIHYMNRYSQLRIEAEVRVARVECLTSAVPAVFFVLSYEQPFPSGNLVPREASQVFDYPILDNGWLMHTKHFDRRAAHLGIVRADQTSSLSMSIWLNGGAIVSSENFAMALASTGQSSPASNLQVRGRSDGCETNAWVVSD